MPRAKALNTYPPAYWKICQRCAVGKEVFEHEVESITQALSLQGQFYAFRGALHKAYDHSLVRPIDPEQQAKIKATLEFCELTVCWVDRPQAGAEPGPVKVRFMHRDNTPAAQLLSKFLDNGRPQADVQDADIEESAASLLEALNLQPPMKGYMK